MKWLSQPKKLIKVQQEFTQNNIWEVLTWFLTNDEINIINQHIPNPEISWIVIQIIDELCKQIYDGKNPNSKLLEDVYRQVLNKNKKSKGIYRPLTKSILPILPDWKTIAHLFNHAPNSSSNTHVSKFREARLIKLQLHSTKKQGIPNTPTKQPTELTNIWNTAEKSQTDQNPSITSTKDTHKKIPPIQKKVKAQYEKVEAKNYDIKFPNIIRTEKLETNVPLLSPEDIAFSYDAGWGWRCLTKGTKVPTFDIRWKLDEFIEKHGERKDGQWFIDGKQISWWELYCFYNQDDDISHINSFHIDRGISGATNIAIKGKVSQQDATKLLQYLENNNILRRNPLTGKPTNLSQDSPEGPEEPKIQKAVIELFNNNKQFSQ